jgi:hypothetical protein
MNEIKSPNPKLIFKKIPNNLDESLLEEIVDFQEENNKCKELTKALELYSSVKLQTIEGLKKETSLKI